MKYTDIKDLSQSELKKKKQTMTKELFEMNMKNSLGQLSNPVQIRFLRKDLARVNTAMNAVKK